MIRNRKDLAKVKRIVVKVGTTTITYPNCNRNFTRMDHLCRELADVPGAAGWGKHPLLDY